MHATRSGRPNRGDYEPLQPFDMKHPMSKTRTFSLRNYFLVIGSICALALSFHLGTLVPERHRSAPIPLGTETKTFHYDSSFGGAPSNLTDTAWDSLFPAQGGFFKHPKLAPQRSGFAVFHQLHCLDGIRKAYWLMHDAAVTGSGNPNIDDELPLHTSPVHVRHCVDLLRQALMCAPDLTVEVKDEELGGVTGFGTEHQCVAWGSLTGWLGKWEDWEREIGKGSGRGGSEHSHHNH